MTASRSIMVGALTAGMVVGVIVPSTPSTRVADPIKKYQLNSRPVPQENCLYLRGGESIENFPNSAAIPRTRSARALINPPSLLATRSTDLGLLAPVIAPVESDHVVAIKMIQGVTGLSDERIGRLLGVSRQTLAAWKSGSVIRRSNEEALSEVADIIERAASRYANPTVLQKWLDEADTELGLSPGEMISNHRFDEARYSAMAGTSTVVPQIVRITGAHRTTRVTDDPLAQAKSIEELV